MYEVRSYVLYIVNRWLLKKCPKQVKSVCTRQVSLGRQHSARQLSRLKLRACLQANEVSGLTHLENTQVDAFVKPYVIRLATGRTDSSSHAVVGRS